MCGIVGVLTDKNIRYNSPELAYFEQALFTDTLRGSDSTGIAVMNSLKMDSPEVYKKALAAPDFLQLARSEQLLHPNNAWDIMLGHNRAATRGGVSHSTAHPFQIGDITLIHNGTVINHRQLPHGNDFTVDSEAITSAVNEVGIAAVVKKLDGAFTLAWHDAADGTVNFIRNDERPLWIGITKDKSTLLFASEGNMLRWLAVRNRIELDKVFQPAVGAHYKYEVGTKDWATTPKVAFLDLFVSAWKGGQTNQKKQSASTVINSPSRTTALHTGENTIEEQIKKNLGLEGSSITFVPDKFIPYKSDEEKKGCVEGKIEGIETKHFVRMYNVPREDWVNFGSAHIVGDIKNCFYDTQAGGAVLLLSNDDYLLSHEDGRITDPSGTVILDPDDEEPALNEDDFVAGPHGSTISVARFDELTKHGCVICEGNVYAEDADDCRWTTDSGCVCPECTDKNNWN